jgi:ABC-type glycerol-3-phosphate transport system substrate-binding protein
MKKIMALVLAAMMLLGCCSFAVAEDIPEGYPEIIEGLDFGGQTVYIYQWYDTPRSEDPTDAEQATYDYQDWLMKTYNVKIVEENAGSWDGMASVLQNLVTNHDNSKLIILGISSGFVGPALANGLFMPWTYGKENFNDATVDFMTVNGVCYGVCGGKYFEPRQCVFFNKDVLEAANINWEELYDLQANGEWTWDKMEEYMEKVQRDLDNDDVLDVYALTGNGDDGTIGLVVSNKGDFFDFDENGKLVYTADKDNNTLEALARRSEWNKYYRPNENWDDYQRFWPEGNVAFFIGQSYEGFNGNSTVNGIERWGCLAMPKGPAADDYTSAVDNNIFGIPNVYDEETSLKLQMIYTLYRMPTPGADEDAWADNFYALTDDRAIEETYAMLREKGDIMKFNLLGDRNTVLGNYDGNGIIWRLGEGTPLEVCEEARPGMEARCAAFNGDTVAAAE